MIENPTTQKLKIAFLKELLRELSDPEIIHNAVLSSEQLKKSNAPAGSTPRWNATSFADQDVQKIFSDHKQKIEQAMQGQDLEQGDGTDGTITIDNKVKIDRRRLQGVFSLANGIPGGLTCKEQIILGSVLLNAAHEVVFPYFRQRAQSMLIEEVSPLLNDDESSSSSADLSRNIINPCQKEVTQSIFRAFPLGQEIFEPAPKLTITKRFKRYLKSEIEILETIQKENIIDPELQKTCASYIRILRGVHAPPRAAVSVPSPTRTRTIRNAPRRNEGNSELTTLVEDWIDGSVNQFGDYYGPRIIDASFVAFSNAIAALTLFKSKSDSITSTLSPIWYYLNAVCFLLMGFAQLSDEREHRRTMRKIKGLINVGNGTQLMTFTAMNAAAYGGTALTITFGTSFLHSIEEVHRRGMCIKNPNYWYEDTKSELRKLEEELSSIRKQIQGNSVSRFFMVNPINRVIKLSKQQKKLDGYINAYRRSEEIPANALMDARKDFIKTLLDSAAQGVMFAAVTTNYAMPNDEAPEILSIAFIALASVMLILKYMFSESLADNLVTGIWNHNSDEPNPEDPTTVSSIN